MNEKSILILISLFALVAISGCCGMTGYCYKCLIADDCNGASDVGCEWVQGECATMPYPTTSTTTSTTLPGDTTTTVPGGSTTTNTYPTTTGPGGSTTTVPTTTTPGSTTTSPTTTTPGSTTTSPTTTSPTTTVPTTTSYPTTTSPTTTSPTTTATTTSTSTTTTTQPCNTQKETVCKADPNDNLECCDKETEQCEHYTNYNYQCVAECLEGTKCGNYCKKKDTEGCCTWGLTGKEPPIQSAPYNLESQCCDSNDVAIMDPGTGPHPKNHPLCPGSSPTTTLAPLTCSGDCPCSANCYCYGSACYSCCEDSTVPGDNSEYCNGKKGLTCATDIKCAWNWWQCGMW